MAIHANYTLTPGTPLRVSPPGVSSGEDITIQNTHGSAIVYVGGETVSDSSYGFRLSPGRAISFELPGNDSLYVASPTEGATIAVLSVGLERLK